MDTSLICFLALILGLIAGGVVVLLDTLIQSSW